MQHIKTLVSQEVRTVGVAFTQQVEGWIRSLWD